MSQRPRFRFYRPGGAAPRDARSDRRAGHLYWLSVTGFVLLVIGTVAAVLALVPEDQLWPSVDADEREQGRLALEQVDVRNGPAETRSASGGGIRQTLASMPTIDLTFLNHGRGRVLLEETQIEIVDYAAVRLCGPRGGGTVSIGRTFGIRLPEAPLMNERTLVVPLHRQIGAGGVDRIALRFDALRGDSVTVFELFALHVRVRTSDNDAPLDIGRFVIVTPSVSGRSGGDSLPEDSRVLAGDAVAGRLSLEETWCFERNLAAVRRFAAMPGRRAPEVAALRDVRPTPNWSALRDATSAREAALRLMRSTPRSYPEYAVAAAERSDDPSLLASIRERAVADLLSQARRTLADGNDVYAAELAREAGLVHETAAVRQVVATAERRAAAGN